MRGPVDKIRKKADGQAPHGVWPGKWSGYTVEFETPEGTFVGDTRNGIRGSDTCDVTVSEDGVSFETNSRKL